MKTFVSRIAILSALIGVATAAGSRKKCYAIGERCIGAKGYDAVAYYPCCRRDHECNVPDKEYGFVCGPKVTVPPRGMTTTVSATTTLPNGTMMATTEAPATTTETPSTTVEAPTATTADVPTTITTDAPMSTVIAPTKPASTATVPVSTTVAGTSTTTQVATTDKALINCFCPCAGFHVPAMLDDVVDSITKELPVVDDADDELDGPELAPSAEPDVLEDEAVTRTVAPTTDTSMTTTNAEPGLPETTTTEGPTTQGMTTSTRPAVPIKASTRRTMYTASYKPAQ